MGQYDNYPVADPTEVQSWFQRVGGQQKQASIDQALADYEMPLWMRLGEAAISPLSAAARVAGFGPDVDSIRAGAASNLVAPMLRGRGIGPTGRGRVQRLDEAADTLHRAASGFERHAEQQGFKGVAGDIQGAARGAATSIATMAPAAMAGGTPAVIGLAAAGSYSQAKQEGKDAGLVGSDLEKYALESAGGEAAITAAFSGLNKFLPGLGGIESEIVKGAVSKGIGQAAKRYAIATGAELLEEELVLLDQQATKVAYGVDPNAMDPEVLARQAYKTGLQTLLASSAVQSPNLISNLARMRDKPSRSEWKDAGMPPGTPADVRSEMVLTAKEMMQSGEQQRVQPGRQQLPPTEVTEATRPPGMPQPMPPGTQVEFAGGRRGSIIGFDPKDPTRAMVESDSEVYGPGGARKRYSIPRSKLTPIDSVPLQIPSELPPDTTDARGDAMDAVAMQAFADQDRATANAQALAQQQAARQEQRRRAELGQSKVGQLQMWLQQNDPSHPQYKAMETLWADEVSKLGQQGSIDQLAQQQPQLPPAQQPQTQQPAPEFRLTDEWQTLPPGMSLPSGGGFETSAGPEGVRVRRARGPTIERRLFDRQNQLESLNNNQLVQEASRYGGRRGWSRGKLIDHILQSERQEMEAERLDPQIRRGLERGVLRGDDHVVPEVPSPPAERPPPRTKYVEPREFVPDPTADDVLADIKRERVRQDRPPLLGRVNEEAVRKAVADARAARKGGAKPEAPPQRGRVKKNEEGTIKSEPPLVQPLDKPPAKTKDQAIPPVAQESQPGKGVAHENISDALPERTFGPPVDKDAIARVFPEAKITPRKGGGWHVEVGKSFVDVVPAPASQLKISREMVERVIGRKLREGELEDVTALGSYSFYTPDGKEHDGLGLIKLLNGVADEAILRHEALHLYRQAGMLSEKEWDILAKKYGKPGMNDVQIEEEVAKSRETWKDNAGLWENIQAFIRKLLKAIGIDRRTADDIHRLMNTAAFQNREGYWGKFFPPNEAKPPRGRVSPALARKPVRPLEPLSWRSQRSDSYFRGIQTWVNDAHDLRIDEHGKGEYTLRRHSSGYAMDRFDSLEEAKARARRLAAWEKLPPEVQVVNRVYEGELSIEEAIGELAKAGVEAFKKPWQDFRAKSAQRRLARDRIIQSRGEGEIDNETADKELHNLGDFPELRFDFPEAKALVDVQSRDITVAEALGIIDPEALRDSAVLMGTEQLFEGIDPEGREGFSDEANKIDAILEGRPDKVEDTVDQVLEALDELKHISGDLVRDSFLDERMREIRLELEEQFEGHGGDGDMYALTKKRGRLANPMETAGTRQLQDQVDEARDQAGQPGKLPDAEVVAEAQRLREKDPAAYDRELKRLLAAGAPLDPYQMHNADELARRIAMEAVVNPDGQAAKEAVEVLWGRRESRATTARTLRYSRDPLLSPKERQDLAISSAIVEPSAKIAKQIADAKKRGHKQDLERALRAAQEEIRNIKRRLSSIGLDPEHMADWKYSPERAAEVIRAIAPQKATYRDMFRELFRGMTLSSPQTWGPTGANMFSNVGRTAWHYTAGRLAEVAVNQLTRRPEGAQPGEYKYIIQGIGPGIADGLRHMMLTLRTETPTFDRIHSDVEGDQWMDYPNVSIPATVQDALPLRLAETSAGKALGRVPFGRAIRMGQRMLSAGDQLARAFITHLEVGAQAYRIAKAEKLEGDALTQRIQGLIADQESEAWANAYTHSLNLTSQQEGGVVTKGLKRAAKVARDIPVVGDAVYYVSPYIGFALNSLESAVHSSPLGWAHTVNKVRQNVMAGKPALHGVSQAAATQLISSIMLGILLWSNDEEEPWITGAEYSYDQRKRELAESMGRQPLSIKIGNTWYSYARVEPLATTLGWMVDVSNGFRRGEPINASMQSAVGQIQEKSFLMGMADMMEAIQTEVKGERPGEGIGKWASNFAVSWIPNIYRQAVRASYDEKQQRGVWGRGDVWWGNLMNRTLQKGGVGGGESFPDYDAWGREIDATHSFIPRTDYLYRMMVASNTRVEDVFVGDRVLLRWNMAHPGQEVYVPPLQSYYRRGGVTHYLTDEQYAQYAKDAGRIARELVEAETWPEEPTEDDVKYLKKLISQARTEAREKIVEADLEEADAQ